MALSPGTRLGAYEIVEAIGSGGMGEVYRAREARLDRDVAIKVLRAVAAADGERRARFDREAKAVAALNHPNIVTIYSVEEADGIPFFAMEYVEGRTLAQMIPARGLALDELLRIAIPLSDAVAAAHQRGILHRDLKPANVMIATDGRVKVLDFGLAKLREAAAAQSTAGSQATMEATGEERILGTVAYMSPEQAEGKPLDDRSDVFSLGVLLYEIATGQRPFKGDTSVSVISAILKDTPGSVTDLRPELPRDLGRILRRALAKDPERRYQSAKDLRNDLQTLKEDLDSGEISRAAGLAGSGARRVRLTWPIVAGLVAIVCVAAAGAWWLSRVWKPGAQATAAASFDQFTLTPLVTEGVAPAAVDISPDGRYIAYVSQEDAGLALRVRQADSAGTGVLVVPAAAVRYRGVSFSPDGNRLYYVAAPSGAGLLTLYEVPVLGGTQPRPVLENVDTSVNFSPDGARFAFLRAALDGNSAILIANADGTGERTLAVRKKPDEFASVNPAWSSDGKTIAAAVQDGSRMRIVTVDVATGNVRPIGQRKWDGVTSLAWPRKGERLIVTASDFGETYTAQIWEVSFADGTARRITKDLGGYQRVGLTADASTLVTVQAGARRTLWVAPSTQIDRPTRIASVPDTVMASPIRWTSDDRIVYTAAVGGNYDVWAVRRDGTDLRQLTTSPARDGFPSVAPDGRYIAFMSDRSGEFRIWRMEPDGSRQTMLTDGSFDVEPVVAPDSRHVYFIRMDQPGDPLYMVPVDGGQPTLLTAPRSSAPSAPWPDVPAMFMPQELSPDGTQILGSYFDDQGASGRRFVVVPVGGRGTVHKLDIPIQGRQLAWAPDGRAITYVRRAVGSANLWRQPLDGGQTTQLTNYPAASGNIPSHAWSRDGKWLALVRATPQRQLVLLRDVGRHRR